MYQNDAVKASHHNQQERHNQSVYSNSVNFTNLQQNRYGIDAHSKVSWLFEASMVLFFRFDVPYTLPYIFNFFC